MSQYYQFEGNYPKYISLIFISLHQMPLLMPFELRSPVGPIQKSPPKKARTSTLVHRRELEKPQFVRQREMNKSFLSKFVEYSWSTNQVHAPKLILKVSRCLVARVCGTPSAPPGFRSPPLPGAFVTGTSFNQQYRYTAPQSRN